MREDRRGGRIDGHRRRWIFTCGRKASGRKPLCCLNFPSEIGIKVHGRELRQGRTCWRFEEGSTVVGTRKGNIPGK